MARWLLTSALAVAWETLAQAQTPARSRHADGDHHPQDRGPAGAAGAGAEDREAPRRQGAHGSEGPGHGRGLHAGGHEAADADPAAGDAGAGRRLRQCNRHHDVGDGLPQAKPRTVDPLLGGKAMPQPTATQPQEYPTLLGKLRQNTPAAPAPTAPAKQSAISTALFGSHDTPKQPTPTLVGKLTDKPAAPVTATTKAATFGGGSQPVETPTLASKLFGDKPQPHVNPPKQSAVQSNIIRPAAVSMTPPPHQAAAATGAGHRAAAGGAAGRGAPADPHRCEGAELPGRAGQGDDHEADRGDRQGASHRSPPTNRLEAANALAACPMAGMVEVRQIIAEAATATPCRWCGPTASSSSRRCSTTSRTTSSTSPAW